MRSTFILACTLVSLYTASVQAAVSGRVAKVLPQYLDLQGRASLSPSLYERDAYQAWLVKYPGQRGGLVFNILWRAGESGGLKIRVEARGAAPSAQLAKTFVWEKSVVRKNFFSRWEKITVPDDDFKNIATLTAWRVTLWDGDQQIGEQKSFLW